MDEARSQQSQAEGGGDTTQPVDEDAVFDQVVGGPYKNRVYGKGAFKTQALSSASVTGALRSGASGSSSDNEIRDQVHRLNLEIQTMTQEHQRQLEEMQAQMERERAERDSKLSKLNKKLKRERREQQKRVDAQIAAQIAALRAEFLRGALHPSASGSAPPPPTDPPSSSSSSSDDDDGDDDAQDYD